MKRRLAAFGLICAVLGLILVAQDDLLPLRTSGPILLELFTSQGCSSCPPADRLLTELAGQPDVVALSFHVDYWDSIGWVDPFSDRRWSDRQRDYVRRLRSSGAYTPQLVVNGSVDVVGSKRGEVARLVAAAAPLASIGVTSVAADDRGVKLRIETPRLPASGPELRLWLAVSESGLDTAVRAGENSGRVLHNDHVVRDLRQVRRLAGGAAWSGAVRVELRRHWSRDEVELVAFVRDAATLEILAVGSLRPFSVELPADRQPSSAIDR